MTPRRALAAGLLFLALGAFTVQMSYPIDCHEEAWVVLGSGIATALLTGGAVLALLWNQPSRPWVSTLAALTVWIITLVFFVLRLPGACGE